MADISSIHSYDYIGVVDSTKMMWFIIWFISWIIFSAVFGLAAKLYGFTMDGFEVIPSVFLAMFWPITGPLLLMIWFVQWLTVKVLP
jgi:hypothetical protein